MADHTADIEKASDGNFEVSAGAIEMHGQHHYADIVPRTKGFFGKLWDTINGLDEVEFRGIERVLPNERDHIQRLSDCMWMWLAASASVGGLSLGIIGVSVFHLDLRPAILTIIFSNLLSSIPAAYFSTFGLKLGLRQLTLSRFSFSLYFPNCLLVILNAITCVGWSAINCITGALTLRAVSQGSQPRIPSAAAIVLLAVLTLIPSFVGYKYVHAYQRYSWIPMTIIFFIALGLSAKYFEVGSGKEVPTSTTIASILSFGAVIFGAQLGWCSFAADYTVKFPEDISSFRVFIWAYIGLAVTPILLQIFGTALVTIIDSSAPRFAERYARDSIGGLLSAALDPAGGFGQFCLVVLAFGIVSTNILNVYSFALTTQALHPWFQAIPRPFICIIGTVIYVVLAIVGIDHFETWLATLLTLLSCWLAIYCTILIEEHLIFRRGRWGNYEPDRVADLKSLPVGIAAFVALGAGVAGYVLGMSQAWYVGVLAKKIEPQSGADIGFELAAAFSGTVYPIARYVEKRKFGR